MKEPSVLGRLQLFFLSTLALNVNEAGEKRRYTPWLNADTVLWWLQPTTEMNLEPLGFETFFFLLLLFYQKQKGREFDGEIQ